MENATKALLIAGSILIAILLIALGLRVFNSTRGTVESSQSAMNTTEIAAFNNKFLHYLGKNKSKSQVIALANVIISNNSSSSYKVSITILGSGPYDSASNISAYINGDSFMSAGSGNIYSITFTTTDDGRINAITVS